MNEYEVQHYSKYHRKDLVRQGKKEQRTRRLMDSQEPETSKRPGALMLLLINLINLIRGF